MTDKSKRCGTCRNWVRTTSHGGSGGSVLACKARMREWSRLHPDASVYTHFDIEGQGYGPHHVCHRPDDYELKEQA